MYRPTTLFILFKDDDCFGSQGSLGGLGVKVDEHSDEDDAMDIESGLRLRGSGCNLAGSRNRSDL